MSVKISTRERTYSNGKSLSEDLRTLIIDKLQNLGASHVTGKIPCGVVTIVAKDLKLSNTVVSKIWKYYVVNKTVVVTRNRIRNRILSEEDEDYIRQLVLMKPTLYKREIRQLVLQNTNTRIPHLSMTTVFDTVRHRISGKQFTIKKTQCSNQNRWSETNLLYTRNFFNFIQGVDPYSVRFVDEASVNFATSYRTYGASESGTRALDISVHKQGDNYTIFCLIGLNDTCYVEVVLAPSDGNAFINFIHRACCTNNNSGHPIVPPGTVILTDSASIHCGYIQTILKPYLQDLQIHHYFLPKFSPDTNPAEEFIGTLKSRLRMSEFAALVELSVPTAVLAAADTISPGTVYKFFKNVSCNYMNM